MYCSKCGNQNAEGARFCSFCGSTLAAPVEPAPVSAPAADQQVTEITRDPAFAEFNWNVQEYPDRNFVGKTEDVNFDWGADPKDIRDRYTDGLNKTDYAEVKAKAEDPYFSFDLPQGGREEQETASERVDKFYTFNRKNEEFQNLLNREYEKIRNGNPIEHEKTEAEKAGAMRFDERAQDNSMDAFLEREGIVKPYEPKAFESDVLERIEAQERAKEEARLEEEARQRVMEEARLEAEAEKRRAEEARIKFEEEARIARENQQRIRAEEEARAREAEEMRIKLEAEAKAAAEEAKRAEKEAKRAEEEARIAAAEEERRRAEEASRMAALEAARIRKEQEEERLREEARKRAEEEAAKIREQREARLAAAEEEKQKLEMQRRLQQEEQLRRKLKDEQTNLARQADSAAAAEEARRVLAQTARMREEEAAKIRAAVAGLRNESSVGREEPVQVTPAPAPVAPEPMTAPVQAPVVPEPTPVAPAPTPRAIPVEPTPATPAALVQAPARTPAAPAPQAEASHGDDLRDAIEAANRKAHQQTRNDLNEMAKARQEFLADFGNTNPPKREDVTEPVPATVEELLGEKPVTGRNTMLSGNSDMSATRVVKKDDVMAAMEQTLRISKAELKEKQKDDFLADIDAEIAKESAISAEDIDVTPADTDDLLSQFEAVAETSQENETVDEPVIQPAAQPEIEEGFAAKEEPMRVPEEAAMEAVKPGLHDTMVMPTDSAIEGSTAEDLDSLYAKEAEEFKRKQAESMEKPATKPAEDTQEEKPEKEKDSPGRIILKIVLILLVVIFAAELAGIGIKFMAPNSKAAEFIDNQLNKVIHLITGSATDYEVPGVEYRV